MRVTVDLGFSSLVLVAVVCVVVPAIGFVVRLKWRRAAARAEEVKRLLVLAAEESARAESEAAYSYQYGEAAYSSQYGAVSVPKNNQCAVCFSPTTTRCARCKAVRYCSGKCQIVHWRQGHKEECHPPSTAHQANDLASDLGKKVAEPDNRGIHDERSQIESTEYTTSSEKPPLFDINRSPKISYAKDDNVRVEPLAEENITGSNSDLSSNSFSGFSASTSPSESSDDSSVCESIISNEHERSEGHTFADPTHDISDITSNGNSMGATIPLSPKFASLVDSVDGFSTMPKLNKVRPGFGKEEIKLTSNGSPGLMMRKGVTIEPSTVSSGFWNGSIDLRGTKDGSYGDPLPSHSNGIQSGTATSSQAASCSTNSKNGLKTSVLKVVDQFRGSNLSKHFPLAVGSDVPGKYSDKGLFPYDLFVRLYNWNRVEFQPFGLANCGNSCYANAVLQCLIFTPPLTAYLLQGLHSKSCANKKRCLTCEFESLILKSRETKSPLSPTAILSQLQNMGSQLGNGREEDAHEFLRHVVETMQSVCLMESGDNASDSLKEETNLMGLTFGGYLRSKIKCMKCGGKSERQERMMDLTVEIEGEIATLEEALRRFTSTETLDGENKYHCIRCKSYEKAKKKMAVSEAPNVLTIALKRFRSGRFGKLNKPIRFPEILDLAPFMSGTSDLAIYRLYGVIVHLDTMNAAFSGHYVCYVKNFQNSWFKVDDSVVTTVESETVLSKGAYMLFYARCSPRAPRLIRNMIVYSDSKSKVNGKTVTMKSRYVSSGSGSAESITSSIPPDGSPALETMYPKFHLMKRIVEEDSSSDNSSLISSNSDEGSCSTDSTCDSTSTEDFADYIFGNSGGMLRNSNPDTFSTLSSSHLNSRHLPLSDSVFPHATGLRPPPTGPKVEINGLLYRAVDVERSEGGVSHLHRDSTEHRKLDTSRSSSSIRRTDSLLRSGSNHFSDINSGVSYRKSRERTD